ncbi:MAG: hypothetical protein ABI165_01140, partial [Bryobacteraceae bacterium]
MTGCDRRRSASKNIRRLLPLAMVLSLPLALAAATRSFPLVMAHLFSAMFIAGGFQILTLVYGTEIFSQHFAGYLGGIASGSYGVALAILMPVFGKLFDLHRSNSAFAVAALC